MNVNSISAAPFVSAPPRLVSQPLGADTGTTKTAFHTATSNGCMDQLSAQLHSLMLRVGNLITAEAYAEIDMTHE